MATLESQYESFKKNNPESTFTFDEWKKWYGEMIADAFRRYEEQKKKEEDDKQHRDNQTTTEL